LNSVKVSYLVNIAITNWVLLWEPCGLWERMSPCFWGLSSHSNLLQSSWESLVGYRCAWVLVFEGSPPTQTFYSRPERALWAMGVHEYPIFGALLPLLDSRELHGLMGVYGSSFWRLSSHSHFYVSWRGGRVGHWCCMGARRAPSISLFMLGKCRGTMWVAGVYGRLDRVASPNPFSLGSSAQCYLVFEYRPQVCLASLQVSGASWVRPWPIIFNLLTCFLLCCLVSFLVASMSTSIPSGASHGKFILCDIYFVDAFPFRSSGDLSFHVKVSFHSQRCSGSRWVTIYNLIKRGSPDISSYHNSSTGSSFGCEGWSLGWPPTLLLSHPKELVDSLVK